LKQFTNVISIAPGLVVVPPRQLPFGLIGEKNNRPLSRHWDRDACTILSFFEGIKVEETTERGWRVINASFDNLQLAISDAAWMHVDASDTQYYFSVDCRSQDAILELDQWYHVDELFSGIAHQYYAKRERSSNRLELNRGATPAISQRLKLLATRSQQYSFSFPKLTSHISNAISWVSRARNSSTSSDRFLCTWIAAEYLTMSRGESEQTPDIKSTLSSRLGGLLGRADRNSRRYWESALNDCYELRCELMHEAAEDSGRLATSTPLLMQAVVEAIFFCVSSLSTVTADTTPSEMLDGYRRRKRAT
jgi:hypothetical protein